MFGGRARGTVGAALLGCAVTLAACGGGDDSGGDDASDAEGAAKQFVLDSANGDPAACEHMTEKYRKDEEVTDDTDCEKAIKEAADSYTDAGREKLPDQLQTQSAASEDEGDVYVVRVSGGELGGRTFHMKKEDGDWKVNFSL